MLHLEQRRIVHCDLSTRNVLLSDTITCKISGFGNSFKLYDKSKAVAVIILWPNKQLTILFHLTSQHNSLTLISADEATAYASKLPKRWLALEALMDGYLSTASDVWAFAVTAWEIYTLGATPYPDCECLFDTASQLCYQLNSSYFSQRRWSPDPAGTRFPPWATSPLSSRRVSINEHVLASRNQITTCLILDVDNIFIHFF